MAKEYERSGKSFFDGGENFRESGLGREPGQADACNPIYFETVCSSYYGAAFKPQEAPLRRNDETPAEEKTSVEDKTKNSAVVRRVGKNADAERWILSVCGLDFYFNWIPAGKFAMGFDFYDRTRRCPGCGDYASGCGDGGARRSEFCARENKPAYCYNVADSAAPKRQVKITNDFWLMDAPVTVAAFDAFLQATGRGVPKGAFGYDAAKEEIAFGREYNYANPGFPDYERSTVKSSYPATCVDWAEAVAFCDWLSEEMETRRRTADDKNKTLTFRLPTEAEWERACRAETTSLYFFGDDDWKLSAYGNFDDAGLGDVDGFEHIAPAGRFRPNDYGMRDMHGNVWEWCADWYEPYEASGRFFPLQDPRGPSRGRLRVARGGAWNSDPLFCRSATRGAAKPWTRAVNLGFRVAMDVSEQK